MDPKLIFCVALVAITVNQAYCWENTWSYGWGSNVQEEVNKNMENVQKNIAAVQKKIQDDIKAAQHDTPQYKFEDDGSKGHILSQSSSYSSSVDGYGNKVEKRITHIIRQTPDGKIVEETITS